MMTMTTEHGWFIKGQENNKFATNQQRQFLQTVTMDEDGDDDRSEKKRTRAQSSPVSRGDDEELEFSLKKVRISKQSPGQLRLAQDVNECLTRARIRDVAGLRVDSRNPLQAHLRLYSGKEFSILAGRFYPHQPPIVVSIPEGQRLRLPLLEAWLPVYTIADLVVDIIRNLHT